MKIKIGGVEFEVEDKVGEILHSQEVRAKAAEEIATQASPVFAALEKITGQKDHGAAIAALAGLKEKADRADVLVTENTKLTAELGEVAKAKKAGEIVALLDAATADGRLTPVNRTKLTAADAPSFAGEPAHLKAYLDMLPKAVKTEGEREVKGDDAVVALTEEDKKVGGRQKIDAQHMAVFKAGGAEALQKLLAAEKAAKK